MLIYEIALITAGVLMALRTWLYYNYLLINENKEPISIFKYINTDKNLIINYWKVIPVFSEGTNPRALSMKLRVNIFTFVIYLLITIFVIALINNK